MRPIRLPVALIIFTLPTTAWSLTADNDGFKSGGDNTIATDARSIAAGWYNVAATGSIAVGDSNSAIVNSIAVGLANMVGSEFSGGFGNTNDLVLSSSSFIFGYNNAAEYQTGSVLAGIGNSITHGVGRSGEGNVLLGTGNAIDSSEPLSPSLIEGTLLLGTGNYSEFSHAWVFGRGNIAREGTVTLGEYADPVAAAALTVGNGTATESRSNALVVAKDGTVTIPSGNLILGSEVALTGTSVAGYLTANDYLKRAVGSGASAAPGSLIAVGEDSNASGASSIALGEDAEALATGSIAIGHSSVVGETATDSLAFTGGFVNAPYSMAVGGAQTYGTFSMAMMMGMASSNFAIAIGGYDTAWGYYPANVSAGEGSTTIGGVSNKAEGFASFAAGYWNKAFSYNSVAFGSLNRGGGTSSNAWVETDPLLELGNGYAPRSASEPSASLRSNAITTLKNGRTTLENKFWNSEEPLSSNPVTAADDSGGDALVVKGHTRLKGRVVIEEPQGDILMGVFGE